MRKLKALAAALGAVILRPYYYPASDLFRVVRDEDGLQIDFMASIHGARSFTSLRSRARVVALDDANLLVADLADVIRSKKAAGGPQDLAALTILEKTLDEEAHHKKSEAGGSPEGK